MKRLGLHWAEIILLLLIIGFTIRPVENFDFWFHVKYGEDILTTGKLPFIDEFSHTAYGQPAIPYEWLFQVVLYLLFKTFGNPGVQFFVAGLGFMYIFLFRYLLISVFDLTLLPRLFLVSGLYIIGYDFWVERPQSAAYALFMATLVILLSRALKQKRVLWITVPLVLIWTNLHASVILGLYLFFSMALVAWLYQKTTRDTTDPPLSRDLFFFGMLNSAITLLPPLGISMYKLLSLFFQKRQFIMTTIDEWVPLTELTVRYYFYVGVIVLSTLLFLLATWKRRTAQGIRTSILLLPLLPLSFFVMSGVRQTAFTMPATLVLLCIALARIRYPKLSHILIVSFAILILGGSAVLLWSLRQQSTGVARLYPKNAIPFIKDHLWGNMFNEYHMGGYLMYSLGPTLKTFIDGRTDMFLPEILPAYDKLAKRLWRSDDEQALQAFEEIVQKHQISWAILTTARYTPWRTLARLLRDSPDWSLVYFDDTTDIYVRHDGINDDVIREYKMFSVTPLARTLYRQGERDQAIREYEAMNRRVPSAVSENALGFFDLEDKNYEEAKKHFEKALLLYPSAAAPKMNLAELAAKDGNLQRAISLYQQALADDPERGLSYLRLGQLIVASGGSRQEAQRIWQRGILATPDEEIRKKLLNLLRDN